MRLREEVVAENLSRAEGERDEVKSKIEFIKHQSKMSEQTSVLGIGLSMIFMLAFIAFQSSFFTLLCFIILVYFFISWLVRKERSESLIRNLQSDLGEKNQIVENLSIELANIQKEERNNVFHEIVKVKGCSFYQSALEPIFIDFQDEDYEPYGGYSKREIKRDVREFGVEEYKYLPVRIDEVFLVPEPTNPYDPNAIIVQIEGQTVGYIPKRLARKIKKWVENTNEFEYFCKAELDGGEYIGYDYGSDQTFVSQRIVKVVLDFKISRVST